ncbi:FGGY family carbohydrate kinase [Chloroflexota bacterium]
MNKYTLGIDVGTSGVKAGLLDLSTLKLKYVAVRKYESSVLQRSETLWRQTVAALKDSIAMLGGSGSLEAIGISGQMHGTVLYDSSGEVIDPVINWQDKRCDQPLVRYGGKTTIDVIMETLDEGGFKDLGIDTMASGFLGATLFHIKENDPSLFRQIRHAVLPADFIRGRLLGCSQFATDQTNAGSTGLFNTRLRKWHEPFIEKLGLPCDVFPEVHDASEVAGFVPGTLSDLLGIEKGVPVIYGGGDLQMSILGSGLSSPASPDLINIGTGSQIARVIGEYSKIPGIDTWSLFGGNYVHVGASLGGGISYQRLREEIRERKEPDIDYYRMDELASAVPPGSDGLRFCSGPSRSHPLRVHGFYGEGIQNRSTGHLSRAVMEGVILDLVSFRKLMGHKVMGENQHEIMVGSGRGLSNSRVWTQITADMFAKRLQIIEHETAVFGAALMAACGISAIGDKSQMAGKISYNDASPDSGSSKRYQSLIRNEIW